MIELLRTRHLRYFGKAQIIFMRFTKGKHHMNKILTQMRTPGYASMTIWNTDHCFGGTHFDEANGLKHCNEMMVQFYCVCGDLPAKKSAIFFSAMTIVDVYF